ncbi:MAG: tRNA uridine-5-carboxymethylaminomethyl(34) synthesis enzyme MnmG [Ignavibacteria bacterium]|nr:tRNA uridine-5-carboxymethylaminomethyl(34) synthesis enzyme MnmG [Ignavibacteria bacterium]
MERYFDIIVVGAGHAGVEASIACAKMGLAVALVTMDLSAIGRMSCNPAIGGTAKGHLVREIDALGGAMGILADKTGIQFKMLNRSKGPAVWSPRCQSDKDLYSLAAAEMIKSFANITLVQDTVKSLKVEEQQSGVFKHSIKGIVTELGSNIQCKSVIITSGTFLNAIMHTGTTQTEGGRAGEKAAKGLSDNMLELGFVTGRLKTGTPPRLDINTIDFSKTELQGGDGNPKPFSFRTPLGSFPIQRQIDCFLTYTNEHTHDVLRTGFEESPMFTGRIKGVGPRYCPSIEDKISRFSEKPRHQIFLEPETLNGETIYMNGFSTSLPLEVQEKAARTITGLENVKIVKKGYAVEYDFFPTHQTNLTLETKLVSGLFLAGQINGTSGYEEAAAQGLIAGINAGLKAAGKEPFILKRSEAYIGVLIDDLINKCPEEPYRMFTSCAEYRLILRQDNADLRLMKYGYELGLLERAAYDKMTAKKELIHDVMNYFSSNTLTPKEVNEFLKENNSSEITQGEFISNLVRRNEIKLSQLIDKTILKENNIVQGLVNNPEVLEQIEIELKYKGYIQRQIEQVNNFNKNEEIKIPEDFKYDRLRSLSAEAREKLNSIRPNNIGQAMRIAGVRPSDISALLVYMRG